MKTHNNFQKLIRDINWLGPTIGLITFELSHLFEASQDSNVNNPRCLTTEAERVNSCRTKTARMELILNLVAFWSFLSLIYSPIGLIMQRQDTIMEWIFFSS